MDPCIMASLMFCSGYIENNVGAEANFWIGAGAIMPDILLRDKIAGIILG